MNKILFSASAFALLMALSSFTPQASADGFYVGGGLYGAELELDGIDSDDTVPAMFLGYQFLDTNLLMAAVEVGIYDMGHHKHSDFEIETSAYTAAGALYFPIGPMFEVYGKLGIASIDVDTEIRGVKRDLDAEEAFGGVGASIDVLDTLDLYVEYLQFDTEHDAYIYGIGFRIDF